MTCFAVLAVVNGVFLALGQLAIVNYPYQLVPAANGVLCALFVAAGFMRIKKRRAADADAASAKADGGELAVLRAVPGFLCLQDDEGRWLVASNEYLRLFNIQNIDYQGKTNLELSLCPGVNSRALRLADGQDSGVWQGGQPLSDLIVSNQTALEVTRTPVLDQASGKRRLLLMGGPVKKTDAARAPSSPGCTQGRRELASLPCDAHFGWALLDGQLMVTEANMLFAQLFGRSVAEVVDKPLAAQLVGEFGFDPKTAFAAGALWSKEVTCQPQQGTYRAIKLNISQITQEDDAAGYFVSAFDMTKQRQAESRIIKIAHYDDLTGLFNRTMFCNSLAAAMAKKAKNHFVVVFFIDLDRFKAVNDSLGHSVGDQLLKEAAARLSSVTRRSDIVARLSGDEFAVMMEEGTSHEHAVYAASMVAEKIVQKISEPFFISRNEVFIGASIGIAVYPEDAKIPEELLKLADISMYEAKRQGRSNYQFYKKAYTDAWQDRLGIEKDLRKAIERKELELYYQPQYGAANHRLHGAEVLVRWLKGPPGNAKMVPPDQFISIAEETGLIIELGAWILERACAQMAAWKKQGLPLHQVSVNVSPRQFADHRFLQTVENALDKAGLEAKHLELELTESILQGDVKQIELQLQRLKKLGIALALDDFGTGYSSLSYLRHFPIDVVKIDKSFIHGTPANIKNVRITCAIINMGHSLGQKVVAEGVETEEQLDFLRQRGCDLIQGYYFSRPLPTYKMTELLGAERSLQAAIRQQDGRGG